MAVAALVERPPTGFLRDLVLEPGGARAAARSTSSAAGCCRSRRSRAGAALAAGVSDGVDRRAAATAAEAAGTLDAGDAAVLREAFAFMSALRMEHQVGRLRAGLDAGRPDRAGAADAAHAAARSSDAFRAVARVQRGIALQLGLSAR